MLIKLSQSMHSCKRHVWRPHIRGSTDLLILTRRYGLRGAWRGFHGEGYAFPGNVDLQDRHFDLLIHLDDGIANADKTIGKLTDMDEAILMPTEINIGFHNAHAKLNLADDLRTSFNSYFSMCSCGSQPSLTNFGTISILAYRVQR